MEMVRFYTRTNRLYFTRHSTDYLVHPHSRTGSLMTSDSAQFNQSIDRKLDRILNDLDFIKNRTATYLGRNEALTYLADETPIFVNTDDLGCPLNFMNGGVYEEDYFRVFQSFRTPNLPMLDIGANLGVYSIRMASMRTSKIHAFEPIPRIRSLFARSIFLNGLSDRVNIHACAVSDTDGKANLSIPSGHAGGATLESGSTGGNSVEVDVKCLDDLFNADFRCGLIKLDVEGHELHALRGMNKILARSPEAVLMFEKLAVDSGIEGELLSFFKGLGWSLFHIIDRRLLECDLAGFKSSGGYFIATRRVVVDRDGLERDFFHIYPSDLNLLEGALTDGAWRINSPSGNGSVLLHGPYWWLPRGYYRVTIDGTMSSDFRLEICEKFGYKVTEIELKDGNLQVDFAVYRDLAKFEIVLRSLGEGPTTALLNKITFRRLG